MFTPIVKVQGKPHSGEGFSRSSVLRLGAEFKRLTKRGGNMRVHLFAHGDWFQQRLGKWNAQEVCDLLVETAMPQVRVVSVQGCSCGRDRGSTLASSRIAQSMDSFGSHLHWMLGERGIYVELHARVYVTSTEAAGPDRGKNLTLLFGNRKEQGKWKRKNSKRVFTWAGGRQVSDWAYDDDDDGRVVGEYLEGAPA